jgi:N-acyl homoserine lactone hydrolase
MTLRRLALALLAAVTLAAPAAAQRKAAPDIRLYTMDCGRGTFPDADMFADDGSYKGKPATMVVPCYLIRHPKGDLVWDTGVSQSLADQPGGGPATGLRVQHKLTDMLKQLGVTPADVKYLSVSHSHYDHIGNGGLFAKSTWIVDPDEKAYAFRPQARADTANFAAYSALEGAKTILIEKPSYDVFGDGTVVIYQAPGHTPGHTVLLVRLAKAGPVLLTGDMWHIAESRAARRVPRFNTDRAQTLASMDLVEKLAAETHARVIREHVPADFDTLPKFPEPLR